MTSISTAATEYVKVRVSGREGGRAIDLSTDAVWLAFLTSGTPVGADWEVAEWETVGDRYYYARCLVGPDGGVVLDPGAYRVWVKVAADPETPVLASDTLTIT